MIRIAAVTAMLMPAQLASAADTESDDNWPLTHFAWGADVSSSIDLTGQDLSSFNIAAAFGYKNKAFQLAGAGCQIDMAVGNSCRMYPIYAIMRTSFTSRPSRCFMEVKAGYAFNRMARNQKCDGIYASASWGINLAMGRNYRSFIIVGYTYRQLSGSYDDLSAVTAGIGINF